MDAWPEDHRQGHKRTYNEMAQHATLSPSPFFFGAPSPSPHIDNTPIFVERRRTSHPHNNQHYHQPPLSSFFSPARDSMADRHPSHRPSLAHQASQTIIDLTDDADDADQEMVNSRLQQGLPRRPPQLGRTDGSTFDPQIIDLTDDAPEDELEITGARELRPNSPHPAAPAHRHRPRVRVRVSHAAREALRESERNEVDQAFFGRNLPHDDAAQHHHPLAFMDHRRPAGFMFGADAGMARFVMDRLNRHRAEHQQMPVLDYGLNAFHVGIEPVRPAKPAHEPPPPAKNGFTRSPTENDTVICPGCEEELVAKKVGEDDKPQSSKKSSKPPSKKDREEHPFWVVKECGHVYCNKCYQFRKYDKKTMVAPIFPETAKENSKSKAKVQCCAVEGCESEVTNKDRWVGVFI